MSIAAIIPNRNINTATKGVNIFLILSEPSSINIKEIIKRTVRNIGEIWPRLFTIIIKEVN